MKKSLAFVLLLICVFPSFVVAQKLNYADTPQKFEMYYFSDKGKTAVATIPFTAEEFRKLAPNKIDKDVVTVRKHYKIDGVDSFETVKVPVETFVAELNKYEEFLNKYGETLRDGKLNKTDPNDASVQSDLGVLFFLRDRDKIKNPTEISPSFSIYKPDKFSRNIPYDPMGIFRPNERLRFNPDAGSNRFRPGIDLRNARTNQNDFYIKRGGSNWRIVNGVVTEIATGLDNPNGGHVLRLNKADAPPAGCATKSDKYTYSHFFPDESSCSGSSTPTNNVKGTTDDVCPENKPQAGDPACLYLGEISPLTLPLANLDFDYYGGNGWFGGFANFNLIAKFQQKENYIGMSNDGIAGVGIQLLGSKVKLLGASNYVSYETGQNAPTQKLSATAMPDTPFSKDLQTDFSVKIAGPSTSFLVGPVPISISSDFNASVGLDKKPQPFLNIPTDCTNPQIGSMTMFLGPKAKANVNLRAAIDAFVASAGIEGELILLNDSFGGRLTTEISPSTNRVTFKPSINYSLQHLAGKIYIFVELDLLIYSKKWSIEVFNFDGFNEPNKEIVPVNPIVISSKSKK